MPVTGHFLQWKLQLLSSVIPGTVSTVVSASHPCENPTALTALDGVQSLPPEALIYLILFLKAFRIGLNSTARLHTRCFRNLISLKSEPSRLENFLKNRPLRLSFLATKLCMCV